MQSLWTGLSALTSASDWLDRVSDNISNIDTPGFAADAGSFSDMLTSQLKSSATGSQIAERYTPPGWSAGTGVLNVGEGQNFAQMPLQNTGNSMDLAIQGPGFFELQGASGKLLTKAGDFTWSPTTSGQFVLSSQDGLPVLDTNGQPIVEPSKPTSMSVGADGQITFGTQKGPKLSVVEVSTPDESLDSVGSNEYQLKSGYTIQPASSSTVAQGELAMSNVNLTTETTDMIQAQNMFDLNSESVQLTDKMMGIADSIK